MRIHEDPDPDPPTLVSIGHVEVEGAVSQQRSIAHQLQHPKVLKKAPKFKDFNYKQSTDTVRISLSSITGKAGAIVHNLAAAKVHDFIG
jgi:hypothetical protein